MQISGLSASNTFSATDVLAIEVNVNGTNKTYKMTGATLATALASIGSYLKTTDVVNNLTSTATDKPLSANMGKELNDKIGNLHCLYAWNTTTINVDIGFAPDTSKSATGILVNGNQSVFALLKLDVTPSVIVMNGTKNFTISLSGSNFTITANETLWGATMILWMSN